MKYPWINDILNPVNASDHGSKTVMRKAKRKPRACTECNRRRVKCSKSIPCAECIRRHTEDICKREEVILDTKLIRKRKKLSNTSLDDDKAMVYNPIPYKILLERLSIGEGNLGSLDLSHVNIETNWVDLYEKCDRLLYKIDFTSSRRICVFACKYTSFINQGIIPQLFIQEHDSFWKNYVLENRDVLFFSKRNQLLDNGPRDYYYWLSLYYIMIGIGIYFGYDLFESYPTFCFTSGEMMTLPSLFFQMSMDCLLKAEYSRIPDIRSIQIYCCMSMVMHALGRVHIDDAIMKTIITNAQLLKMDRLDYRDTLFSSEINKRLWETLCVIDWLKNSEIPGNVSIPALEYPPPALITQLQLLGLSPITDEDIQNGSESIYDIEFSGNEFSNALYLRFLFESSKIYNICNQKPGIYRHVNHCFLEICKLHDHYLKLYKDVEFDDPNLVPNLDTTDFTDVDRISHPYTKFLLNTSLTEVALHIGNMLLPNVGKEQWALKYREKCLRFSIDLLQRVFLPVPKYYLVHWIVVQHLIYASMYLLLDMLMFSQQSMREDSDDPVFNYSQRLKYIEASFPLTARFESSHLTAKVGLAVIKKLHLLVSSVQNNQMGRKSKVEEISLMQFLKDLKISVNQADLAKRADTPLNTLHYFRTQHAPEVHQEINNGDTTDFAVPELGQFGTGVELDPMYDEILDGTGWREFLNFFYGDVSVNMSQNEL